VENINTDGISISEVLGIGRPADQAAVGGHEVRKKMLLKGVVKVGEVPVEYSTTYQFTEEKVLIEETIAKVGICAGDGRVFESNSDVASACLKCGYALCHECAEKFKCASCGRQACPHCGTHDGDGEFYCTKCH